MQTRVKVFPKSGDYVLNSNPIFAVVANGEREIVVFDAKLTLKTGDPYLNENRKRAVDLEIVDWEATAHSKLLKTKIRLRMTQDGRKLDRRSYVEADVADGADFPATAQFVLPYEIETDYGTMTGLVGVTRGTIRAFPPLLNDMFHMEKIDMAWSARPSGGDTQNFEEDPGGMTPILCAC